MKEKILRVYALAMLIGMSVGLTGALFQKTITFISKWRLSLLHQIPSANGMMILVSALLSGTMVLFSYYLVMRYAPEAAGSGIPEIEGVLLKKRLIFWRRLLPVKFFAGSLSMSAQVVAGREGPTVQMGANIAAMWSDIFKCSVNRKNTYIAAGAAAGLTAAFNAPLAGVLFIIEEMRNGFNFSFTNFKMVAISCVMSALIYQLVLGPAASLAMPIFPVPPLDAIGLFFIFGLLTGFLGLIFNDGLIWALSWSDTLRKKQKIVYVGMIGALIGVLAVCEPLLTGDGYAIIYASIFPLPLHTLLFLLPLRFFLLILCYTMRVPGGIFAPLLSIGTLLGSIFYHFVPFIETDLGISVGVFSVVGMGSLFAAVIRSPLTGIVLVVEMTRNYDLILPLMISCLTSTTVMQLAKNPPIYTQLLKRIMAQRG